LSKNFIIFLAAVNNVGKFRKKISGSLHSLSNTRWSARIDAVKPFVNHLPGLQNALEDVKQFNLTAETRRYIIRILFNENVK